MTQEVPNGRYLFMRLVLQTLKMSRGSSRMFRWSHAFILFSFLPKPNSSKRNWQHYWKYFWKTAWDTNWTSFLIIIISYCQVPGPGLDQPGLWPGQPGHQLGQTKPWPTSSSTWPNLALTLTKPGPGVDTIIKQATPPHPTPPPLNFSKLEIWRFLLFNS